VGLDLSPPMLDMARERLAPFGDRARVLEADLHDPDWPALVTSPCDAVVSRYAIHHLPDQGKRAVYAASYRLLASPGVFLNVEHVASTSRYVQAISDRLFIDTAYEAAQARGEAPNYAEIERRFATRPDAAANILASAEDQLAWLRDAGFADVDCYWKCFELAILGGFRHEREATVGPIDPVQ
jgi:SAM-dependent methyltransferase